MKRKICIALGLVVLFGAAVVWVAEHKSPHFVGGVSPHDFKEIQKVIRQAMWRGAFPNFSTRTLVATPKSLWCLGTSRIEQVDVFPGGTYCYVHVRTPQGINLFDMQAVFQSGKTNWQISSQGLVGEAALKRLGSTGFAKFLVRGGVGLLGGKLPTVFYTPAVYHDQFESDVLLLHHFDPDPDHFGLDLNPISVSYGLSNRAKVDFRP
jgi:hypothetical protein